MKTKETYATKKIRKALKCLRDAETTLCDDRLAKADDADDICDAALNTASARETLERWLDTK